MVEPGRYSLTQGVPVQVSPDARITLLAVDDSRCPEGVQCIWAGRIAYQLELASCGKTEQFVLTAGTQPQAASHTLAAAPPMRIALAGEPPPRGPASARPVERVDIVIGPG
jgi:hypothetical protein